MKQGDKVKLHYTGTLSNGEVFDSSEGKEPLEFTIGENHVIPGFENEVREMGLNEEKTFKIAAKDAYGEKNQELTREIPKNKMPAEMKIEAGAHIIIKGSNGQQIAAVVSEVKDDSIVIDLNHPLAGKELTFKVKVVEVN